MKSLSNQSYKITKGDIVTNFKSSLSYFNYKCESDLSETLSGYFHGSRTLDIASYLIYNKLHDYCIISDKLTLENLSDANISYYM